MPSLQLVITSFLLTFLSLQPLGAFEYILEFCFGKELRADLFPSKAYRLLEKSDPEVQATLRLLFGEELLRAKHNTYATWKESPRGRLALILLFDTLCKKMDPEGPDTLYYQAKAQELALEGIKQGDDLLLFPIERAFFYRPLQFGDSATLQAISLQKYSELLSSLPKEDQAPYNIFLSSAKQKADAVQQFGRLPENNTPAKRPTTQEEKSYLAEIKEAF